MIDWVKIKQMSPNMYHSYMDSKIENIEDFFTAMGIFVELRLHEMDNGEEMYSLIAKTKNITWELNSMKSVLQKGKIIQIRKDKEFIDNNIFKIFEVLEEQIQNKNYLLN